MGQLLKTVACLVAASGMFLLATPVSAGETRRVGLPRLEFETPAGLSPQAASERTRPAPAPVNPRGVMGYRLPLVSRQRVPAQVVSGVLIPAHTTYVILRPGYWELAGSTEGEVGTVPAASDVKTDNPSSQSKTGIRGWSIWRLFRRSGEK